MTPLGSLAAFLLVLAGIGSTESAREAATTILPSAPISVVHEPAFALEDVAIRQRQARRRAAEETFPF